MRKQAAMALLVGVAAALVVGCSSGDDTAGTRAEVADEPLGLTAPEEGDAAAADEGSPPASAQRDQQSRPGSQATTLERKLARTARVALASDDIEKAADDARAVAEDAGGFTGNERLGDESARLSLHVPADALDDVLDRLAGLGEVTDREVASEDVTEQIADVDSRVESQRASVARVRVLLDKAETINEIVTIEEELTWRQSELDSLLARQEALAGMVAMSTVTVIISADGETEDAEDRGGFLGGLSDGWDAFLTTFGVLLTVLGAILPFLLVLGVPLVAAGWLVRRRRRLAKAA